MCARRGHSYPWEGVVAELCIFETRDTRLEPIALPCHSRHSMARGLHP